MIHCLWPSRTQYAPSRRAVVDYKVDDATGRPLLPAGYKPKVDEEYMSPLQQEYFRRRDYLRCEIQKGIDSAEAGNVSYATADEIIAKAKARMKKSA